MRELDAMGGTSPLALQDPDLMEIILPTLRKDLGICEDYRPATHPPLRCPLLVLCGREDRTVPEGSLEGWRQCTRGEVDIRILPGGHFNFLSHPDPFFQVLTEALTHPCLDSPEEESRAF